VRAADAERIKDIAAEFDRLARIGAAVTVFGLAPPAGRSSALPPA